MRKSNGKSKIIAFLCIALVFMGIGYATLQSNLSITGTAKASGVFNVEIFSIAETQDSVDNGGVTTKSATRNASNTEATFDTSFSKPGDYVEYKVTVKNTGTIDAVVDMEIDDSDNEVDLQGNDIFLFEVIDDTTGHKIKKNTTQNVILEAGQSRIFTVKMSFNSAATEFPSQTVNFVLTVETQQIGSRTIDNLIEDEDDELDYTVDSNGLLLTYSLSKARYDQDGYLLVPAVNEEGEQIKHIDRDSFSKGNAQYFYLYGTLTGNSASGYAVLDDKNFDAIKEALEEDNKTPVYTLSEYNKLKNEIDTIENLYNYKEAFYLNLETGETEKPIRETRIDLSDAIYLQEIKNSAFLNGPLVGIKLPQNGVFSVIENNAFYGNQISGTLTIPSSVTSIGNSAFYGNQINSLDLSNASNLQTIGNSAFKSNQISGTVAIPSGVTSIGEEAFYGSNNQITSLTIPNSVTTIGSDAFKNATIQSLSIDMQTIPSSIFDSKGIQTLSLGNHVQTIVANAFQSNQISGLDLSNASGLQTIGNSAFYKNQLSGTLTIPSSVTSIGENAFFGEYGATKNRISNVVFESNSHLQTIGQAAFEYNQISGLDLSNARSLQTIGDYAFEYNQLSGTLTIPSSVISIGTNAFRGLNNGTSPSNISVLDLSNATSLETIGDFAFFGNQISSLDLSSLTSLQSIGIKAFAANCISGSLVIPNSVTSIGSEAFASEYNLITSLTIPNSVTSIGSGVLIGKSLSSSPSLLIDMTNIPSNVFKDINFQTLTLGNHVQTIADKAFYGCNISTLTIPNNVTTIGSSAFFDNKINTLNLGSGLTSIGQYAFASQIDTNNLTVNINMTQATWNSRNFPANIFNEENLTIIYTQS